MHVGGWWGQAHSPSWGAPGLPRTASLALHLHECSGPATMAMSATPHERKKAAARVYVGGRHRPTSRLQPEQPRAAGAIVVMPLAVARRVAVVRPRTASPAVAATSAGGAKWRQDRSSSRRGVGGAG